MALGQEVLGHAAVKIEQHRPRAVFRPEEHPLFEAVDVEADLLRNAAHSVTRSTARLELPRHFALDNTAAGRHCSHHLLN